jgi:hypothetical protein
MSRHSKSQLSELRFQIGLYSSFNIPHPSFFSRVGYPEDLTVRLDGAEAA